MTILARLLAVCALLLMATGIPSRVGSGLTQEPPVLVDIADVPLPVSALPEDGFQVMAGGYLDAHAAAVWIAEPRQRASTTITEVLDAAGVVDAYVMDLVLLEDRGYATSDILALVQTNVFLLADPMGADVLFDIMSDFSGADVEEMDPAIPESTTVRLVSQSGDTVRSVFVRERLVIEVVSLEGFDFVQEEDHREVVTSTAERAERVLEQGGAGVAPRVVRLADGDALADFQNIQQSGVHHLYRIRDGVVQPAAGQLDQPMPADIAEGVRQVFHASEGMMLGGGTGTGFMSTWIGEFGSDGAALDFMEQLAEEGPTPSLVDPFFAIAQGEQATPQGVAGLYRVTGLLDGQSYSGTLEVRQQGTHVVAIGFRTLGSALPPVDVTSRVMDYQLGCLEQSAACPPLSVHELLAAPSATPVAQAGIQGLVVSEEFGWSVRTDSGDWQVQDQFSEAGYDFVELRSGTSLVTLESVINQHGDAQQCVLDELDALQEFESSAVIDLGSDVEGEQPAGLEPGHGWAIYTVEPLADERADQEYTIRIDCYTLIEGGANLVVTHRAPRYEWASERERGDEIRQGIELPASSVPGRDVAWSGREMLRAA